MAAKTLSLTEEALQILTMYVEDEEHKPHQKAALDAFKASAAADDLSDKIGRGQMPPSEAGKARDAHVQAHELHSKAAAALAKAGQMSTASAHVDLAKKHAKQAVHYHGMHQAHATKSVAVGESVDVQPQTDWRAEQRSLMGLKSYPSLSEASPAKPTPNRQRLLAGIGYAWPSLAEARAEQTFEEEFVDDAELPKAIEHLFRRR